MCRERMLSFFSAPTGLRKKGGAPLLHILRSYGAKNRRFFNDIGELNNPARERGEVLSSTQGLFPPLAGG